MGEREKEIWKVYEWERVGERERLKHSSLLFRERKMREEVEEKDVEHSWSCYVKK